MIKYYHGTNKPNLLAILPPTETGVLREDFRKKFQDVIFVTTSQQSALKYAHKATKKYGGVVTVYEVKPDFDSLANMRTNEYTTKYAIVKNIVV